MSLNKNGKVQSYWPIGKYQFRLLFVHYRLELPELIQGLVIFTIGLSMIEIMTSVLQMTYEAALAIVMLNHFIMLIPSTFGVPFVSGFITPLIPILVVFLGGFEPGPQAIRALIAVQLVTAIIFFILGVTGLGRRFIILLPNSLKAGILIGAGIGAIMGEIQSGGRVVETPVSLIIGGMLCLYIMFSLHFKNLSVRNKYVKAIANYGIVPAIIVAMIIGWITKEYASPRMEWGITLPDFTELWNVTPFAVGFPELNIIITAVPTAILAYIIAYGDIVVGDNLIKRANTFRKDESIDYDLNQVHVLTSIRGILNALFVPHPGLAGPIFTAGTASVAERYTFGKKAMQSIFSGTNTLLISLTLAMFILPLITLFQPFLPIALSITLILTGYLCINVGVQQIKKEAEIGVATVMAIVLALYGAAYGLIMGVTLYLIIQRENFLTLRTKKRFKKSESDQEV